MAAANWTLNQVLAQLDGGQKWSGNTITYAFPSSSGGLYSQGEAAGFRAVNDTQRAWMTLALATWDDLIPQAFAPGTAGATAIEFGYTSTNIGYAHAYYPSTGSVWFNVTESSLVSTTLGQYGFQTFVHEIGHALGLDHMGDYNGNGNWAPSSYQDSVVLSIMSYFGPRYAAPNYSAEVMQADWVAADGETYSPQTPMLNDVMAIQAIYGTSTSTRLDNTVYGFGSTVGGPTGRIYDFNQNPNPILTVFDAGGTDTLDFSGWTSPSRIDLHAGAFSSVNHMTNNIAIAYNTVIENARGGGGNDVLIGNDAANELRGNGGDDELRGSAGDDTLVGGAGNDTLDGGAGNDTAVFEGAFGSYTINVNGGTVTLSSTASGTDVVSAVERFQFADGVRTIAELSPGADTGAPQLQSRSPADGATAAAIGANLVLGFSEAVKAGSGSIDIYNADGSLYRRIDATDAAQVRFTGNTVTVDPAVDLLANRGYYVVITAGAITDLSGNAFAGIAGNTAWNFNTTGTDSAAPQLVSLSPSDDSTAVGIGANLVMVFNENVIAGSGNIVIRAGGQVVRTIAVTDTSQVSINGSTVAIDPAADLAAGGSYSITVDAGAFRDSAGNAFAGITGATAWTFSTAAAGGTDDYPYSTDTPGVVVVNGAAASGSIETGGDEDLFRVDLVAGVTYTFTLQRTAGGLSDPYLGLFSPTLALMAQDDDGAGSGNSRISFTAAVSGTHYLAAMDYDDTGTGAYTLRATTQDSQAPTLQARTPADDGQQVAVGANLVLTFSEDVVAGSGSIRLLGANGQVLREIPVSDSQAVHISGNTVTVDPGANLPAGAAIVVNVDAGAFRDAAGNGFAGISGSTAWNFTTATASATDDFPLSVSTGGRVLPGGAAVGARIDGPEDGDLFKVDLVAGVTYRFDMVAPQNEAVDPYLVLYGQQPDVDLIAYDDDSGPLPLDARLYFTPSSSGTYFLAAFDYAEATGSYTLQASVPTDDYLGSTATGGRLTVGAAATGGTINVPSDIDFFVVTLTGGAQYTFDLKSTGLEDPYLTLLNAAGVPLGIDDDSGLDLNAQLTYTVPTTGTYYLAVSDFDTGAGGYTLSAFQRNLVEGSAGADRLLGGNGADTLVGHAGNDELDGGAGDDLLQGGAGIDLAVFHGRTVAFELEPQDDGWAIRDTAGNGGRDLLHGVERLLFDDGYWALDLDGNAGITAKILGAVFGPASVYNEAYVGIGLDLLDGGMSYPALMQLALDAALGPGASHAAVVNLLYTNVVGNPPPPSDLAYFRGLLDNGSQTPATLGILAAETDINLANIDLPGLIDYGIGYI